MKAAEFNTRFLDWIGLSVSVGSLPETACKVIQ